jgi:WD40 repeat protein
MPLPDGRVLAIGRYEDGTVRRWDAATGEPVGEPIPGPQGDVGALAAAGGILVIGDSNGTVHRWDPVTGEPLAQAQIPETDGICHLGVLPLPDGERMIVATGCDGSLTRWPTADLGTADRADVGDDPDIMGLQLDPTGVPVAYIRLLGTRNAPVQRWRLDTLERVDTLPDTVRAVYASTMVHSDPDGSLRTEPLPPLPIG